MVITDGVGGGLRGSGTMPATDIMVVHFDHLPHRDVQGHIQPNGDIKWANGKAWLKYEGEWQSPGSASESMSPKLVNESLIVAAPAELAPQEPQANLAAWDDDVVDTPHARACEALKAVKIGQVRPEADGSAVAAHSGSPESPGSASESLSPGSASESLVVAAPTELAPPGPHAKPAAPAQDARYFLRNADGSMMTEEEAAPMAASMAAQDLAQERDRLQRAQEIERLVMEARGLRPPG